MKNFARLSKTGLWAWTAALVVSLALGWVLWDVIYHGVGQWSWHYFTTAPSNAGRDGGIASILISTLLILGICLFTAVPLGLGCALFLSESFLGQGRSGRWVRTSLDATAAVPSIVFGLFGNAFFAHALGLGFSLWSGGLTLACMVLPLFIRSVEAALRAVPQEQRLAAAALDLSLFTRVISLFLPTAAPGIFAGFALSLGRAMAETAALLFTSGYVLRMPESLYDSGRSLAVHIFDLAMNVPGGEQRANAAGASLVAISLLLHLLTSMLSARQAPQKRRLF